MDDEPCWTEADWKLFRKRLPGWQEAYMERLMKKYASILNQETLASTRFWRLEEEMNRDKKCTGVIVEGIRRSMLVLHMMRLVREEVISDADLEGFSPNLREAVKIAAR